MRSLALILTGILYIYSIPTYSQNPGDVVTMSPGDPVITYNSSNPPSIPPDDNLVHQWVKTNRLSWGTESFKTYIYNGMAFRLKFPTNYDASGNTKYPLILMLHGRGERGPVYDNEFSMRHGGSKHRDAVDNGDFNGFVMFPQNTAGTWYAFYWDEIASLFQNHMASINVDMNRISVHGLSDGGAATWKIINQYPKLFAAAAPMSASPDIGAVAENYNEIDIWSSQGGRDPKPTPSRTFNLIQQVWAAGGNVRYTLYENLGHGVWNTHYNEADFFPFFTRANKVNPTVLDGEPVLVFNENNKQVMEFITKIEFCDNETVYTRLSVTEGFDAYEWRKDGVIIPGATSNMIEVTEFGIYDVRFQRNGQWTYWSPVPVEVIAKPSTESPPIEVTGLASKHLPAPDGSSTVQLEVPSGFLTYTWRAVGTTQVLSSTRTLDAPVGSYEVSVTEPFGCSSTFSAPFNVIPADGANAPPPLVAVSGSALATTSIQLQWSQIQNPTYNETGFEIYRKSGGSNYVLIDIIPADVVSYTDTGLLDNIAYTYLIRPINDNGAAQPSEKTVTTLADTESPSVPSNLRVIATSQSTISLEWNPSSDNVGIKNYNIYVNDALFNTSTDTQATLFGLTAQEAYRIHVVAEDYAGNLSPASNQVIAVTVLSGLTYKYYEGTWSQLPDFDALTPVKTGSSDNVDISVREQNDNFGFMWDGYINIPIAGDYTFETYSDDGSKLYINGVQVVDNDGLHGNQYREGTYNFASSGSYPIKITFFENGGGENIQVFWKNTAHGVTSREQIPDAAFTEDYEFPAPPPTAPSNLDVTAISYEQIDLTWSDNSSDETGFQVFRSEDGISFEPVALLPADTEQYQDIGLAPSTTYYYQVSALGQYGSSDGSSGALPLASLKMDNNFDDSSGNNVLSNPNGNAGFSTIAKQGTHSMTLDGNGDFLDVDTGNQFIHDAFNQRSVAFWMYNNDLNNIQDVFDEGGSTNGIGIRLNGTTIEAAVQDNNNIAQISAPFTTTGEWRHVAIVYDYGNFELYLDGSLVASDNNVAFSIVNAHGNGAGLGGSNSSNAFDGGNNDDFDGYIDDFYIFGSPLNTADISALIDATEITNFATTFPLPPVPDNPTDLEANSTVGDEVTLIWTDINSNELGYKIYRSYLDNQSYFEIASIEATTSTVAFTDTGLLAHTQYYYKVAPFNVAGEATGAETFVTTSNTAPSVDSPYSSMSAPVNETSTFAFYASDGDNDPITIGINNLPSFGTFVDNGNGTGMLTLNPALSDVAVYQNLEFVVNDEYGGSDSHIFDLTVTDNKKPVIENIPNTTVREGESTQLNLVGSDPNGIEGLQWSLINDQPFITINDNADGTATMDIAPLFDDQGSYFIFVRLEDPEGASAIKSFLLTITDFDPTTRVDINFSKNYGGPSDWNNTNRFPSNGHTFTGLIDAKGQSTTFGVQLVSGFINSDAWGYQTGDDSGVVPDQVAREYYFFDASAAIRLVGLDPNETYDVKIFGSSRWRGPADNGTNIYTINGVDVVLDVESNFQNFAEFSNLTPEPDGTIDVSMASGPDAQRGFLNALILTQLYNTGAAPRAPILSNVVLNSSNHVVLTWTDESFNEDGFYIFRSEDGGVNYTQIGSTGVSTTSFTDTNIEENATYFYRIQSYNENGTSPNSNAIEINIPSVPPVFTQFESKYLVDYGGPKVITFAASDQQSIIFSFNNLPGFMSFVDNNDGTADLTVNATQAQLGTYPNLEVIATDALGLQTTGVFEVEITDPRYRTISFNFSRTSSAAAPWNNLNRNPIAFDTFTNLYDNKGNLTPIEIAYNTNFNGQIVSDGAVTGDDSGVVPDNVLRENFYFGTGSTPTTLDFTLTNLDPGKFYNLTFIGSSVSGSGNTDYSAGGNTLSLNVEDNTQNSVTISGLSPDASNEIAFSAAEGVGANVGYINGIVIQEYDVSYLPAPTQLAVQTVSSSELALTWTDNAGGETGYEVYEGPDGNNLTLLTTLPANSNSFNHTSLTAGSIHYYQIVATNGGDSSDPSNLASGATNDFTVSVNLNNLASGTGDTYSPIYPNVNASAPWNNFNQPADAPASLSNLLNDSGVNTGIDFAITQPFEGDYADGWTTLGDDSGYFPDAVLIQHFYMITPGVAATVQFENLSVLKEYDLEIVGSYYLNISSNYTVNGITQTQNNFRNTSDAVVFKSVKPDVGGNIAIDVTVNNIAAVINGIRLTSRPDLSANTRVGSVEVAERFENEEKLHVNVYPNPFQNENLKVSIDALTSDSNTSIELYNIYGQLVYKTQTTLESNRSNLIELETQNLETGIYLIQIQGSTFEQITRKIIKQ